jgi:hypothetical protein
MLDRRGATKAAETWGNTRCDAGRRPSWSRRGGSGLLRVPILGGSFGYFCGRLTSCTGEVYCNGGPAGVLIYTTGSTTGRFLNAYSQIRTGEITIAGERFVCPQWPVEGGAGVLAGVFLQASAPQAGDVANGLRLAD